MKVSKENYNKIKKSITKVLSDNNIKYPSVTDVNRIHNILCLIERQPNNINSINFKKQYKVNIENYFNDFYLNDETLKDYHLETCFIKIADDLLNNINQ